MASLERIDKDQNNGRETAKDFGADAKWDIVI